MARSLILTNLLSQPEAARDEEWEQAVLHALVDTNLTLEGDGAQAGADGWPYLFVRTAADATEPAQRILHWLSERGIGLVLNAHKQVPDYIFSYGMIWYWRETGSFFLNVAKSTVQRYSEPVHYRKHQNITVGPPTLKELPPYAQSVLRKFFSDQGIKDPKVTVIRMEENKFDLCFSLESLGKPEKKEHSGIAEAIAWFLPNHYSVVLASEQDLPPFYSLASV